MQHHIFVGVCASPTKLVGASLFFCGGETSTSELIGGEEDMSPAVKGGFTSLWVINKDEHQAEKNTTLL